MTSVATKRLSWSLATIRRNTKAAMPEITARKALILGGYRRTHVETEEEDQLPTAVTA